MHRQLTLRRLVACILLPCYLVACTTWKTQELSPERVIAEEQPDKVLVKLADGSSIMLEQPTVSGDTLAGIEGTEQRHIPLADVSAIEVPKTDALLTTVAVVFGSIFLLAAVALVVCAPDCMTAGLDGWGSN